MSTEDQTTIQSEPTADGSTLETEASRPAKPERRTSKRRSADRRKSDRRDTQGQDRSACPACNTLVGIDLSTCPHCDSSIAAHNALAREQRSKLDDKRPFWEKIRDFFLDPEFREDAKIILPGLLVFFLGVVLFRIIENWRLFWPISIVGGLSAYFWLRKSRFSRYISVDLYRTVLVFGLFFIFGTAVNRPSPTGSAGSATTVEVLRPVVNVRQSATTDSPIVVKVREGDKLEVVDQRGEWYQVKMENGKTGWVYSTLVSN